MTLISLRKMLLDVLMPIIVLICSAIKNKSVVMMRMMLMMTRRTMKRALVNANPPRKPEAWNRLGRSVPPIAGFLVIAGSNSHHSIGLSETWGAHKFWPFHWTEK